MSRPPAALLVAAVAAVCAGCLRRGPDPAAALARVEYTRRDFRSSLAGCTDPASGMPMACVRLEIDYVEATRATAALAEAIGAFLAATALRPVEGAGPVPTVEELRDDLYERYREQRDESAGDLMPWTLQRSVTVACNTERVQGLVATERSSAGAGETVERIVYRTFDTQTGEPLGLDVLVADELLPDFTEAVRGRLEAERGAAGALFDRSGGTTGAEGSIDRDAVLICPDAVTVQWIDAGGRTAVVVPRDELRSLLRADAP